MFLPSTCRILHVPSTTAHSYPCLGQACLQARHSHTSSQTGPDVYGLLQSLPHSVSPPAIPTMCYYITYLTTHFAPTASICNYISGVCMLHTQLALKSKALDSFPVKALLRATDITMHTSWLSPVRCLPILPKTLNQMCQLASSLGPLAQTMRVCLTFGFFGMLHQSNLVPTSVATFDPSRHACPVLTFVQTHLIICLINST